MDRKSSSTIWSYQESMLTDQTEKPRRLPFPFLEEITGGFSDEQLIGQGEFATVYKGVLANGAVVAVKRLYSSTSEKEFHQEIECLMMARHKNVVRFLGYCSDTKGSIKEYNGEFVISEVQERLLCFEYLPYGSIARCITDASSGLDWRNRYQIIKEIVEGLHYLHENNIIHPNLKPANILLGGNMVPKIADFSLSRSLYERVMTTKIGGSFGYVAPEFNNHKITRKSDLYSLGVIIMEFVTGKKRYQAVEDVLESWKTRSEKSPGDSHFNQIRVCAEIGIECTDADPLKRPSTREIIDRLNQMENMDVSMKNGMDGSLQLQVEMDLLEAAMVVPVSASLGHIGPVFRQLESLMPSERSRRRKGVRPTKSEIQLLRKNLAGLCKELPVAEHTMSFTAKCWMSLVRELCYDTEDCLDEVLFRNRKKRGIFLRIHRKTTKFLWSPLPKGKRKRMTPQIAKDLSELMDRAKDASERPQGFQLGPKATIKPRLPLLQLLEEPMDKLVELLALDDNGEKKQLQVVPILGFAGVGKTTVARALYQRYEGEFQYRAFLQVSRSPDLRMLLTSMLSQIKAPLLPNAFSDVRDLIDTIREHLQDKRYFIIVDDLWTASVWDTISRAFPAGCCGSRIITTTTISDVALACSSYQPAYIFKMIPLNDGQSRKLFFNCVFGSKGEAGCPKYFKPASDGIIRKCGGLPLAIVNTTSLLVSKPNFSVEQWELIQDSIPSTLRTHPTSEGMKEVVEFSYNNLPPHLKTCLLYLTMYPEGYTIRKNELMNQWVAEGFVAAVEGLDKEETAGAYFDELVCRGMIQPVDTKNNDEVLSCTLHHMVLDIIRCDVMEENFITTVNYLKTNLGLADKVRRLSVQFGGAKSAKIPASLRLSQVRSLFFCGFFKVVPSIMDYELLRVLILQIWADQDERTFDLTRICKLFRLRYLKIECNMTVKLPDKIQGLQCLGALQVDARLSAIPSDIVHLQNLLYLCIPSNANLPAGIGHMISLRTLGHFDLSTNSADNVMDLGELTNLQDLHLTCSILQPADNLESNMKCLGFILGKLVSLRCLTMTLAGSSQLDSSSRSISCDAINRVSPLALLQRLEVSWRCCIFSGLPNWIEKLGKLCVVKIAVRELSVTDIYILKELPALAVLSLYIKTAPVERIIFGKTGFSLLRYFKFRCSVPWLKFEANAMPTLQKLKLGFNASICGGGAASIRIEHLPGLQEISAKIGGAGADADCVLTTAISNHPGNPRIILQLMDWKLYGHQGCMRRMEKEQTTQDDHKGEYVKMEQVDHRMAMLSKGLDLFKGDHISFHAMPREMERLVKKMLWLIEEDADSPVKRVEMYYRKRPEVINGIEEFYRHYRSLTERCDQVTTELRKVIQSELHLPGSQTRLDCGPTLQLPPLKSYAPQHSWWWEFHSTQVAGFNLSEIDNLVKKMLQLVQEDADSFMKSAQLYYNNRPELGRCIEEYYRLYIALSERYHRATVELRKHLHDDSDRHKLWRMGIGNYEESDEEELRKHLHGDSDRHKMSRMGIGNYEEDSDEEELSKHLHGDSDGHKMPRMGIENYEEDSFEERLLKNLQRVLGKGNYEEGSDEEELRKHLHGDSDRYKMSRMSIRNYEEDSDEEELRKHLHGDSDRHKMSRMGIGNYEEDSDKEELRKHPHGDSDWHKMSRMGIENYKED